MRQVYEISNIFLSVVDQWPILSAYVAFVLWMMFMIFIIYRHRQDKSKEHES